MQKAVVFLGLALVIMVFWTGQQRSALASLWNAGGPSAPSADPTTGHSGNVGGVGGYSTKAKALAAMHKLFGASTPVAVAQGANGQWYGRVTPTGH